MNIRSLLRRINTAQAIALLALISVLLAFLLRLSLQPGDDALRPLTGPYPSHVGTRDAQGDWQWTEGPLIEIPFRFQDVEVPADAVVRLDIPLLTDARDSHAALVVQSPRHAVQLRWDGAVVASLGDVWGAEPTHPEISAVVSLTGRSGEGQILPGDHTLYLFVRGASGLGGLGGALMLGDEQPAQTWLARESSRRVFRGAVLTFAALVSLSIATLRPHERIFRWYGLLCAAAGVHVSLGAVAWGPYGFTISAQTRVSAFCFAVAIGSALLFAESFSDRRRNVPARVVAIFCFALAALSALSPWSSTFTVLDTLLPLLVPIAGFIVLATLIDAATRRVDGGLAVALGALLVIGIAIKNGGFDATTAAASASMVIGVVCLVVITTTALILRYSDAYETYRQLVTGAPDAILVVDHGGRALERNEAALSLMPGLGIQPTLTDVVLHEDQELLRAHLAGTEPGRRAELRVIGAAGELRWVESLATSLQEGRQLLVMRDFTGRRELEAGLLHAARLETAGILASGIAHDVNNALAALMAHLEMLRLRADERALSRLDRMETVIRRTSAMTRRLLTAVKGDSSPRASIQADAPVSDAIELVRSMLPANISVELYVSPDLQPVLASRDELEQALLNLLLNARDAMADRGGTIRVAVEPATLTGRGEGVRVVVEDQGGGVPMHLRQRIWQPFYTTKGQGRGTGLGLSVVARIARAHGGSIEVLDSLAGDGARFELSLPVVTAHTTLTGAHERVGLRVLVVDDDHDIRAMMAAELQTRGMMVQTAPDAESAQELFRAAGGFDLLVTDVVLPGRSGLVLAQALTALKPSLPVLVVSGFIPTTEPDLHPSWGRLMKPFSAEEFSTAVRRTLMRAHQHQRGVGEASGSR